MLHSIWISLERLVRMYHIVNIVVGRVCIERSNRPRSYLVTSLSFQSSLLRLWCHLLVSFLSDISIE